MARLAGPAIDTDLDTVGVSIDGSTEQTAEVTSFEFPDAVSGLPRLNDCFEGDTMTVDVTGLTSVTNYDFRIVGGASQQNGATATFDTTGLGDTMIECVVTADSVEYTSPPIMVNADVMGTMDTVDLEIMEYLPHNEATHIADTSGSWSDTATWQGGVVPRNGAKVLIQDSVIVDYDVTEENVRLDRLRVDGTFRVRGQDLTSEQLKLLVETVIVTRGGSWIVGTAANRIPSAASFTCTISGRYYPNKERADSLFEFTQSPQLWDRGFLCLGICSMWGKDSDTWVRAEPIDAAATSATPVRTVVGIEAGDRGVVSGTKSTYTYDPDADHAPTFEYEERVLTGTPGASLAWSGGLTYPHKNQLSGSTRTDLKPVIAFPDSKNIVFKSEVPETQGMRGHFAVMHTYGQMDLWDVRFFNLGRTDKSGNSGIMNTDLSDVRFRTGTTTAFPASLSATVSIQGRYSCHAHMLGAPKSGFSRHVINGCVAEGGIGWDFVHHNCNLDIENCLSYKFFGCGFVAETANEFGHWTDCCAMGTTYTGREDISQEPKNIEGGTGVNGDVFKYGYGFGMRGRGVRLSRNVLTDCTFGIVYFHRWETSPTLGRVTPIDIDTTDDEFYHFGELLGIANGLDDTLKPEDMPIHRFADNEAIGCYGGGFVSKELPNQDNWFGNHFRTLKAWGWEKYGFSSEYVAQYLFEGFDSIAGTLSEGSGVGFGSNVHGASVMINCRAEGAQNAFNFGALDTLGVHDDYDSADDPRHALLSYDSVDCDTTNNTGGIPDGATSSVADKQIVDEDVNTDTYDFGADPATNLPLKLADWSGSTVTNGVTDTGLNDQLANGGPILPATYGDDPIIYDGSGSDSARLNTWRSNNGYWQYDFGAGSVNAIVIPYPLHDRATGRIGLETHMYEYTDGSPVGTDNLTFTYSGTAITQADKTADCTIDSTVDIDVVTGATGASGSITLYGDFYSAPLHGDISLNTGTGVVTYTPDEGFRGVDEFQVVITAAGQYKTIRCDICVGTNGPKVTPVVDTDFAASDGGTQTIDIVLEDPPSTGDLRITRVDYTTDGGSTWRRLCHGWVKATHTIDVESDGTAIAASSYDVQIKYICGYAFGESSASAVDAVTVA